MMCSTFNKFSALLILAALLTVDCFGMNKGMPSRHFPKPGFEDPSDFLEDYIDPLTFEKDGKVLSLRKPGLLQPIELETDLRDYRTEKNQNYPTWFQELVQTFHNLYDDPEIPPQHSSRHPNSNKDALTQHGLIFKKANTQQAEKVPVKTAVITKPGFYAPSEITASSTHVKLNRTEEMQQISNEQRVSNKSSAQQSTRIAVAASAKPQTVTTITRNKTVPTSMKTSQLSRNPFNVTTQLPVHPDRKTTPVKVFRQFDLMKIHPAHQRPLPHKVNQMGHGKLQTWKRKQSVTTRQPDIVKHSLTTMDSKKSNDTNRDETAAQPAENSVEDSTSPDPSLEQLRKTDIQAFVSHRDSGYNAAPYPVPSHREPGTIPDMSPQNHRDTGDPSAYKLTNGPGIISQSSIFTLPQNETVSVLASPIFQQTSQHFNSLNSANRDFYLQQQQPAMDVGFLPPYVNTHFQAAEKYAAVKKRKVLLKLPRIYSRMFQVLRRRLRNRKLPSQTQKPSPCLVKMYFDYLAIFLLIGFLFALLFVVYTSSTTGKRFVSKKHLGDDYQEKWKTFYDKIISMARDIEENRTASAGYPYYASSDDDNNLQTSPLPNPDKKASLSSLYLAALNQLAGAFNVSSVRLS